jgi:hypothetical protein
MTIIMAMGDKLIFLYFPVSDKNINYPNLLNCLGSEIFSGKNSVIKKPYLNRLRYFDRVY